MSHKLLHAQKPQKSAGFTIVELMIATLVFSVLLLVVTFGILQIVRTYQKGIIEARTQGVARTVIDDISQEIQFSGKGSHIDVPAGFTGSYAICIGDSRFSVNLGHQLTEAPGDKAFVADHKDSCSATDPFTPPAGNARELLTPNMRVAVFSLCGPTPDATLPMPGCPTIPEDSRLYQIHIRIVYGDDDLLCSPAAGDCNSNATTASFTVPDLSCKYVTGSQFCAVSDLSTTVQKRVE